jgi:oligoendopeptidase F
MDKNIQSLPRWDMAIVYPGLDSPEFERDFRALLRAIDDLHGLFDEFQIDKTDNPPDPDTAARAFEFVAKKMNELMVNHTTIAAYVYSFITTDSRETFAQAKLSELQRHSVKLTQMSTRFTAWIGSLDVESLIERSAYARAHAYLLHRAKIRAQHLMSPAEESLATELRLYGGTAWTKLYGNLTSQITVPVELEGEMQELTMSEARNLAYDPDRALRRKAYEAELQAWERHGMTIAAALNSIKGETNLLTRKRGWDSPLEPSLFNNGIDQEILDAMMTAAREFFPEFRRYLHLKAKMLGLPRMAWYDIFAPVGENTRVWEYHDACRFIVEQFATYSQKLSDFAARAFRENWIDAPPAPGKRDGAFCMDLRKDESRILMNYKPAFGGLSTLAHELGHAYHNLCLVERTEFQKETPMTLAETASIFCETVIRQASMKDADRPEQIAILEATLQGSCQVVVDITSRFLFESNMLLARQDRELSVEELGELMLNAQKETYGDGLDENTLHPYMWAAKPHYYGSTFYNYPYMFGLLFGLGLYALYQQDPSGFRARYDDLLSSTGMADAATLASQFGFDIHTPKFWRDSLNIIKRDIDLLEELVS